jgi:hypothetical protein
MHWHLILPAYSHNPVGYFLYWDKAEAQSALNSHSKCCYPGHQVIECQHLECLIELMAL